MLGDSLKERLIFVADPLPIELLLGAIEGQRPELYERLGRYE